MSHVASAGVIVLLAIVFGSAAPALAVRIPSPDPSATGFTLQVSADRTAADRNDTVTYAIWLNVTGGGQISLARVNVTVDPDLVLLSGGITTPVACASVVSTATFAEWQCTSLRSGRVYQWSVPAIVSANATRERARFATARAVDVGGGGVPQTVRVGVWILLGILALKVEATPSSATQPKGAVVFVVSVTNVIPPAQVNSSNEANLTAYNVRIAIGISPSLEVGNSTPRTIARSNLTPSDSITVIFTGIVNATIGGAVWVNATLTYNDLARHSVGPKFAEQVLTIQPPPALRLDISSAVAVLIFALLAILGAAVIGPMVGERSVIVDEVFLVDRSGTLIHHQSRGPGSSKDDDLVASMFVAIQDFVRDSFHTGAALDEFSFAGRRAAVLRGRHVVLAALLSNGSPRYLFPQMKAVERDIENAHGAALEDWDGRVSRLNQVGPILESFLAGGYRTVRGLWR